MDGGRGHPLVMLRAPVREYFTPSNPTFVFCARLYPPLTCHTVSSDLLRLTAQVVVVSHGDHQEEHSTEEQEHGGIGEDADLH